ncbi:MAG TPA: zeta toxin family protein [Streptosporangiaceae bacterium]|nr:zeta toxin family protein [Streptosporangiaceae bacterium]
MRTGVPDRPAAGWPDEADQHAADIPRRSDGRADGLARRLESLPDGHPSSPYDTDGTRREPPTRLRDLDTEPDLDDHTQPNEPRRPYTDTEWADHRAEVPPLIADAQDRGLATERQFTVDPDQTRWNRERRQLHNEIVETFLSDASHVANDHKAIIAGGLAGAGKTTVLANHAGIDRSQYLTINPDAIKEEMARRGMIPLVDGLSPMEASDLVHPESSHIAKQLAARATAEGKNLIWDITMSSRDSVDGRLNQLQDSGYTSIRGVFVDIPIDVSLARADARHREGEDDYRAGKGMGGRFVPPELITSRIDDQRGSQNRQIFEELKPRFSRWTLFDNGVDGRKPIRVAESLDNDEAQEAGT